MKSHPNFPFAPAKIPFFYGWISMIVGTLGVLCSIPGQTVGVSVFTDYLIDSLQLSRDALSTSYLIGTVSSSLFLTYAGKLYDRFGARITAILAASGLALTLLLFSWSDRIVSQLTKTFGGSFSLISFALMALFFFFLRFSGQGVLTLASRNLIMKWFDKKRGLANSISSALQSFGFAVSPLFIAFIIAESNWHAAYRILALLCFLFILIAFVFYRDNPEECGLMPDGEQTKNKNPQMEPKAQRQYSLQEARKTWVFWIIALSLCFNAFFITGFTFNVISIFKSCGLPEQKALSVFIPASVISIITAIIGNILSDYIPLYRLLIVFLSGCLLSALGVAELSHPAGYYLLIIGNGIMGGLFAVLAAISWPRFFGRQHLGAISGQAMSLIVFSSAIAPLFFSRIFSMTGNYSLAGYIGLIVVAILLLLSRKTRKVNE